VSIHENGIEAKGNQAAFDDAQAVAKTMNQCEVEK
jgi:hypothetical protein